MTYSQRRILGFSLLLLAVLVLVVINQSLVIQLHQASIFSGLALLVVLVVLTLFNARKKMPFLPLLKASTWMQVHIYLGLFSVVLFILHLHARLPRGVLETTLAGLYLAVAGSGVIGLALSRWLPPRLTSTGENLIYERIPALRVELQMQVEDLVEKSVASTHSSTIADFYGAKLRHFFVRPRRLWAHWVGARQPVTDLLSEAEALDQFLDSTEREIMAQIVELIHAKHNLDVQLGGQRLLKLWLFVHIPLTYALLLFALVHGILAFTLS